MFCENNNNAIKKKFIYIFKGLKRVFIIIIIIIKCFIIIISFSVMISAYQPIFSVNLSSIRNPIGPNAAWHLMSTAH